MFLRRGWKQQEQVTLSKLFAEILLLKTEVF